MTRTAVPLHIPDLSLFARRLAAELPDVAGHQGWLNHLARASGHRNWQHLKAAQGVAEAPAAPDLKLVKRALAQFDEAGRLRQFPAKTRMQMLCLWPLWARLPAGVGLSERQLSDRIDDLCRFRDPAQIRRSMVEGGMITRTNDGSRYDRVEQRPPPEAVELIARVKERHDLSMSGQ